MFNVDFLERKKWMFDVSFKLTLTSVVSLKPTLKNLFVKELIARVGLGRKISNHFPSSHLITPSPIFIFFSISLFATQLTRSHRTSQLSSDYRLKNTTSMSLAATQLTQSYRTSQLLLDLTCFSSFQRKCTHLSPDLNRYTQI